MTLPETDISPEHRPSPKGISIFQPSILRGKLAVTFREWSRHFVGKNPFLNHHHFGDSHPAHCDRDEACPETLKCNLRYRDIWSWRNTCSFRPIIFGYQMYQFHEISGGVMTPKNPKWWMIRESYWRLGIPHPLDPSSPLRNPTMSS